MDTKTQELFKEDSMKKIAIAAMALLLATAGSLSAETGGSVVGKWLLPSPVLLDFHDDLSVDISPMLVDLLGDVRGTYKVEEDEVVIEAGGASTKVAIVNGEYLELTSETGEKLLLSRGPADDAYYSQQFLAEMSENLANAREGAKFASCLASLRNVQTAEEMRYMDYGAYTFDPDQLDTYMATDCLEGEGCGGITKENMAKYCDNFEITPGEDDYSYYITANVKDEGGCGICLSPMGAAPYSVAECADGKTAKERCAEIERN